MGRSGGNFRREDFGPLSAKQVSADLFAGCPGDRASWRRQLAHANITQADVPRRSRHLSGYRDLVLQSGGSRQPASGRLRPAPGNARNARDSNALRPDESVAGRADQVFYDTVSVAISPNVRILC